MADRGAGNAKSRLGIVEHPLRLLLLRAIVGGMDFALTVSWKGARSGSYHCS